MNTQIKYKKHYMRNYICYWKWSYRGIGKPYHRGMSFR